MCSVGGLLEGKADSSRAAISHKAKDESKRLPQRVEPSSVGPEVSSPVGRVSVVSGI